MGNCCERFFCRCCDWCSGWGYDNFRDSGNGRSARPSEVSHPTDHNARVENTHSQWTPYQQGGHKDVDLERGPLIEDNKAPVPSGTSAVVGRLQEGTHYKTREDETNSSKTQLPIYPSIEIISETKKDVVSKPENINAWGIEGCNNSCYMDSSLNSMFLFTTNFIGVLETTASNANHEKELNLENADWEQKLRKILKNGIVVPLNTHKKLDMNTAAMSKFRELLSTYDPKFNGNEMDPEEFISTLFGTILNIRELYWIDGDDEGSYVFQTYADMTKPTDCTDVQSLVEYSFTDSDIQLASIPKEGFIIKMPVTDGRHMFQKIYPNPEIDLSNILGNEKEGNGFSTKMILSAVICLSGHHFTTYLREDVTNDSPWWYLDSFQYSGGERIPEMDNTLQNFKTSLDDRHLSFMMSNCYMCFYLPQPSGRKLETDV